MKADSRACPRASNCRIRPRSTVSIRCFSWAAFWTKSRRSSNWCWALRAACSGVMIMARSPGCGAIGCVETDVLPQVGLAYHPLPTQLLISEQRPEESPAGYALRHSFVRRRGLPFIILGLLPFYKPPLVLDANAIQGT